MSSPSATVRGPPPGGGGGGGGFIAHRSERQRPGLLVSGIPPEWQQGMLEYILYTANISAKINHIVYSQTKEMAYVELTDPSVIPSLFSQRLVHNGKEITLKQIDLLEVWKPYLIVQGFPPFCNSTMLEGHFKAVGMNSELESIHLDTLQGQCHVSYKDPMITLEVASRPQEMCGNPLQVKLAYNYSAPVVHEESALTVEFTGLPPFMQEPNTMKQMVEYYFKNQSYNLTSCEIINSCAYVTFSDPTAVHAIVASPPTAIFFAGCKMEYSIIPVSKLRTMQRVTRPVNIPPSSQGGQQLPSPDKSLQPGYMYGGGPAPPTQTSPSHTNVHAWGRPASPVPPQHQHSPVSSYQPPHRNPTASTNSMNPTSSAPGFISYGFVPQSSTDSQTHFQDSIGSTSSVFSHGSSQAWDPESSTGLMSSRMSHTSSTSSQHSVDQNVPYSSPGPIGQPANQQWQGNYYQQQPPQRQPIFTIAEQPLKASPGTSPQKQFTHNQMVVEDIEAPCGQPLSISSSVQPTKILISGIPADERSETTLTYYLQNLLTPLTQNCVLRSVKLYRDKAVATFVGTISVNTLAQLASRQLYAGKCMLSFSMIEPSNSILVSGVTSQTDYCLKLHFERISGTTNTVTNVKHLSSTCVRVTFNSWQCVQAVVKQEKHSVEGSLLSVEEYYPFMSIEEIDSPVTLASAPGGPSVQPIPKPRTAPPRPAARNAWTSHREQLTKEKCTYVQKTLGKLSTALESVKANVTVEENSCTVIISPLQLSSEISDWDIQVQKILNKHLSTYEEKTLEIPKEAAAEVYPYIVEVTSKETEVYLCHKDDQKLTIAGRSDLVMEVFEKVSVSCESCQISQRDIPFSKKHVHFLEKFCKQDLDSMTPPVQYSLNANSQCVCITANPKDHAAFLELVHTKVASAFEKSLSLDVEQCNLLLSKKGTTKINELLGATLSQVVYEFEETTKGDGKVTHVLVFLSLSEDSCKNARRIIKHLVQSESFQVSSQKIRACSNQKWRALVAELTDDNFVSITVVEERKEIVITGEKRLEVKKQVEDFLSEHTSVEERVKVDLNVWKVIAMNFEKEIEGVKSQAKTKKVNIRWPVRSTSDSGIEIIIRGEPDGVDDIKAQVKMLKMNVCTKEEKVAGVPAVVQVLHSVEDRLHVLETKHKSAIEVTLESGENDTSDMGERPRKVCSATAQDGSRVSIYTGDFTQNSDPVGTIISFITPHPDVRVGYFKMLSSVGGGEVERDFRSKIAQFMELKTNTVFKTRHGQLRCTQLLHCVLPPWDANDQQNREVVLEEAIKNIFQNSSIYGSLLLTPITSVPLQYPAQVFAQRLMAVMTNHTTTKSRFADIQVTVYVEELSHAKEFQQLLSANNFQIHTQVPSIGSSVPAPPQKQPRTSVTTAKAISSPISSFITLTKGDMLQQKADVYINSTNSDLDLKNGQLSNLLLKACGDELQQECSTYAPLKPREVAVTSAKNLNCEQIYHIALPDYSARNSERNFRDTVRTILRTAKSSGVSSIAIPSLGVANLHYPASVSAKILLDELIAFHDANPSTSVKMFHLVIYDTTTHQVFSKEYASKMSSRTASPPQQRKPSQNVTPNKQGGTQINVVQGNIADERTDVIVNTTTAVMELSASAASRALLQKAGPNLQSTCKQLVLSGCKLEHGQIAVTKGFDLYCKKVIHAHVPLRHVAVQSSIDHHKLMEDIVTDCLERAERDGMHSISFPAFGLGQGGYSTPEVADPMLNAIKKFSEVSTRSVGTIRIVILDQNLFQEFFDFHCKFFGLSPAAASSSLGFFQSLKSKLGFGQSMDGGSVQLGPVETTTTTNGSDTASAAPPALQAISRSVRNPTAVFHIFTVSTQECDRIANEIRAILKEKAITHKIENKEIIEHLIDDDVDEIHNIGDTLGVDVKFMTRMKEIHISGEKSNVLDAKLKITSILTEAEKAKSELIQYVWQSDDSGAIESYNEGANIQLERAFHKNLQAIEMVIDSGSVVIDLRSMQEINKSSGKTRRVVRVKRKTTIDYPDTWEDESLKDGRPLAMEMFKVPSGSLEYPRAIKEFETSIGYPHYTIESVKRIQNRIEYGKHIAFRDAIEEKHGVKVEQRRLFHGSKLDSLELIAIQGFNRNFAASANAAYFGKGVYFAVNASYSAQTKYAAADADGCQYMLVCNFVVGKYTKGTPKMMVPPTLGPDTKDVFDTLVDNEQNPTIFVAMKDSQAYPEYLIRFKVDRSKK